MNVRHELNQLSLMMRKRFVEVIDTASESELRKDGLLAYLITYACHHCGLSNDRIAGLVEASHTTVSRWKSGKIEPHPLHRGHVIQKLRDAVADDMVMQEKE